MDLIFDEVVSVEQIDCDSLRYDITVAGNHNFFANGVLVHNCQTLRKEWESEWKDFEWEVTEKLEGCLFEGTLVSTPSGVVPIERIKVGDKVVSYNPDTGSDEVQAVTGTLHRSNVEEWMEIELEDGTVVTMTPNHLVYLPEYRCYRRADQLIVGDITKKL